MEHTNELLMEHTNEGGNSDVGEKVDNKRHFTEPLSVEGSQITVFNFIPPKKLNLNLFA